MYRVLEFSDVMADACLRDSDGRLVFLSIFGRDNAILQFLAAMDLPEHQSGIRRFNLVGQDATHQLVEVGGTDRLGRHSGRLPKQNIFGPLSHTWLYDKGVLRPDMANRIAWVLSQHAEADTPDSRAAALEDRVWSMLKRLSPVPLLDTWRADVLAWGWKTGALRTLDDPKYAPIGPISGARLSIGGSTFLNQVSTLIRSGVLVLPRSDIRHATPSEPVKANAGAFALATA